MAHGELGHCLNCIFWLAYSSGDVMGKCRRHAPKAVVLGSQPATDWPSTRAGDGCGDFVMKSSALERLDADIAAANAEVES